MIYLVNEFATENLLFYTEVIRFCDPPLFKVLANEKKRKTTQTPGGDPAPIVAWIHH